MSNARKRHMVDISDAAWDKLEKLAARVDAATYLYKGRPRYGKLIELAIEKLEDSTMEWTVEEVEWGDGIPELDYDNGPLPIDEHYTEATEDWWLANPNITPIKPSQAAQDMALYGNAYFGVDYAPGQDSTVTLKPIKAKDIQFKVSAHDTASEELAKLSETVGKLGASSSGASKDASSLMDSFAAQASKDIASGMAQYLANAVEDAILGEKKKKPDPATIHEADVWTTIKETKAATLLTVRARTDKKWSEYQCIAVRNAIQNITSGLALWHTDIHLSFESSIPHYEYSCTLSVNGDDEFVAQVNSKAQGALKSTLVALGLSGSIKPFKPIEYDAKKSMPPVPYVMWKISQPGYIELTGTITQALSAPQYAILRGFAYAAFAEFSGDEGENALSVSVKSVPWNKLWISATYADPGKLLKKLPDVGEAVAKKVEAWLLQGNFVGPLPQAVDITEKKPSASPKYNVSWSFKPENKLDKNSTMQLRDVHTFVVSQGFLLENSKFEISEHIKDEVAAQYGYGFIEHPVSGNWPELTWSLDGKTLLIKVSVKRKADTPAMFSVQKVGDAITEYLLKKLETNLALSF